MPQSLEEHIWRRTIRTSVVCDFQCKPFFTTEWLTANHDALFPASDVPGALCRVVCCAPLVTESLPVVTVRRAAVLS